MKPISLARSGRGPGRVEGELVADRAAEQVVDRLLADPAEQVPQREVDAGDRVEHDALAAVEERREVHLVPHLLDVGDQLALEEAGQVRSTIHAPSSPPVVTAKPTVPSSASTSTTSEPSTLMPKD